MRIASGVTDQYIYFRAVQLADYVTTDTGSNGKMYVKRSRNGASLADYTTPTITQLDTGQGGYALLLDEDMSIAAGNFSEEMYIRIADTGGTMAPVVRVVELFRPPGGDTGQLNVNVVAVGNDTGAAHLNAGRLGVGTVAFSDTGIQSRLPASLVGGRMSSDVGSIVSDTGWANRLGRLGSNLDTGGHTDTGTGLVAALRTQLTENYAADGVAPTLEQAVLLIQQKLGNFSISGTTLTVHQLNDTGTAATFTLNSATAPTSITRSG